jgi:hypothetical protein
MFALVIAGLIAALIAMEWLHDNPLSIRYGDRLFVFDGTHLFNLSAQPAPDPANPLRRGGTNR